VRVRLPHAARLLADARSLAALLPLARAAGFVAAPLPLPADARHALGVPDAVRRVRLLVGAGPLRALLAEAPPDLPLRDLARALAARLAAHAPHERWLLLLVHDDGTALALAAWTAASRASRTPRLHALVCDPRDVRDSDAETLRALVAHAAAPTAHDVDALLAHQRWVDVLGRDRLGARFYHALARTVAALADSAAPTVPDADARADLALLHTTRCLFLAFLEAKDWLDGDPAFLAHGFDACMATGGGYHRRVLRPLCFGTLNTPRRHRAPLARAFGRVPFLNGGLFAPTALERRWPRLHFDDAALGLLVHDLLGGHRFTAREDATGWSEAAVDPEMLGRAFESLMHARERRATGAFYTPQSIVERLTAAGLRAALLAPPPHGHDALSASLVDAALAGESVAGDPRAPALRRRIATLRLLDPACGSGAFLVHALERLADLLVVAGDERPLAELRRTLLTSTIFGVDRNPTAVWLAELRLWLSVVIESDEPDPWRVPPLPNLDHNVRVGDALAVPAGLAGTAESSWGGAPWGTGVARAGAGLAAQRARYARCTGARKRAAARRLDDAERARALATLDRALVAMRHTRRELVAAARARDLFGARRAPAARDRERLATLRSTIRVTARHRRAIADGAALPFGFGWHFSDAAGVGGFDCVVGNPPWVRPHALPPAERAALRATYASVRDAAWRAGAALAGASAGFGGQVDLAAPFVERSLALLRPGGALALLVPAKLWRALAGGGLRALLAREARLHALEDWSEAPAIFDAATYPSLLLATRRLASDARHDAGRDAGRDATYDGARDERARDVAVLASPALQLRVHRPGGVASATLAPRELPLDRDDPASPWLFLPHDVRAALDRLRAAGTSLHASALARPTLGVKCGCNDAFLLDVAPGDDAPGDDALAVVHARGRTGRVERALLRPVLRGEDLARGDDGGRAAALLWTHGADGAPLPALPPHAARWLAPWRTRLLARRRAGVHRLVVALPHARRRCLAHPRRVGGPRSCALAAPAARARPHSPAEHLLRRGVRRRARRTRLRHAARRTAARRLARGPRRARARRLPPPSRLDGRAPSGPARLARGARRPRRRVGRGAVRAHARGLRGVRRAAARARAAARLGRGAGAARPGDARPCIARRAGGSRGAHARARPDALRSHRADALARRARPWHAMPALTGVQLSTPAEARARIARVALALPDVLPAPVLGDVRLHAHQRVAVVRLARALHEFGGALLADEVGLGKTYIALALARDDASTVVVAPAALRDTWARAGAAARVSVRFVGVESLSRPTLAAAASDALASARLIVVDEAHHLRNAATRRWRRLAALARHARLLLLSATPIHNAHRDLATLLSLFLGERAHTLDAVSLAQLIVRRRARALRLARPDVARTRWHRLASRPCDAALRDAILALPPPLPPRDGGLATTLGRLTLLRLLASSEDALRRAVRRRLARAAALDAALRDGRHLAARELRDWCDGDHAVQLGLALDACDAGLRFEALRATLAAHVDALHALRARLDDAEVGARTDDRIALLRAVRRRYADVPIVAFTQFADTARALYARLAPDGRVALLTAAGGRIASGPVGRRELLARFAPRAAGVPPPPARERVDLLLATDCLSEGLDLRDAGVVVHLDVPWTPARLAQRTGRAARLDGPHAHVAVHGIAPAREVARALRLAARLHAKARAAARVVGAAPRQPRDAPASHVAVAARLERWLPPSDAPAADGGALLVAAVRAPRAGLLAVCTVDGAPVLLAARGGRAPRSDGRMLAWAARCVDRGDDAGPPGPAAVADARRALHRWLRRAAARRACGHGVGSVARAVLARADAVLAGAPAHRRPALAPRVVALRTALARPVPAGTERALAALPPALVGEAWLDAALALLAPAESTAGPAPYGPGPRTAPPAPSAVHALVLLVPPARLRGDSNLSSARPV
jgi:superfamily II DNA or RNA helicase